MRLFIASRFSAAFGERVSELRVRAAPWSGRSVKWIEPKNVHLTWAFLGEVPVVPYGAAGGLDPIRRSMAAAASVSARIPVSVKGLGAFPSLDRPRAFWLGLEAGGPAVEKLAVKLSAELAAEGFVPRHGFSAHITIARVTGSLPKAAMKELAAGAMKLEAAETISSLELIESGLTAVGPEYRTVYSCGLL